ncbi:hypothetical protein SEA_BRAN_50 [Corynebacterium phage Bran]|nr:hypothetical protein SEA_BRAN_50 [Corynebacterium phage Bran]
MLDATQAERLGRNLALIVRYAPRLNGTKTRSQGGTDNAGRAPNLPGPRPPMNLHPLDLQTEAEEILHGWLTNLASDLGLPPAWFIGPTRHPGHLAARLGQVVSHVAQREWGPDAADEIDHITARIVAYVDPPSDTPAAEPTRRTMTADAAEQLVTAAQAQTVLNGLGYRCTTDQIRKWRERGHITPQGATRAGRLLYRLGDISARLTHKSA